MYIQKDIENLSIWLQLNEIDLHPKNARSFQLDITMRLSFPTQRLEKSFSKNLTREKHNIQCFAMASIYLNWKRNIPKAVIVSRGKLL